jgi:hypothetical protein
MSFIDLKYINVISPRLEKFAKKKDYLYNFRCPYCGDSKKNKNRARGFFFLKKSDMVFKCHNCGVGRTLANFLKDLDISLHDEYVMERYKSGLTGKGTNTASPKFEFEKPVFTRKEKLLSLQKISELNKLHPARDYLANRHIPEKYYSSLYYAEDFNKWAGTTDKFKEGRIVIPLMNQSGKMIGYQGRTLNKNSTLRYITIMMDEDHPKIYGLDKIKKTETVYVTEGPFDSYFLVNSIAMCGSDVNLSGYDYRFVFVFDNESRNRQIVDRIQKTIDKGHRVVIFPKGIKEKDLNDMVLAGHDVQNLVESNVYQGLQATIKLNEWKKV